MNIRDKKNTPAKIASVFNESLTARGAVVSGQRNAFGVSSATRE